MRSLACALLVVLVAGCAAPDAPAPDAPGPREIVHAPLAFTPPVDALGGGRGYEPSIDVAPDGTIVVTAARTPGDQRAGTSSWLRYSNDGGQTWQDVPSPAQLHSLLAAAEGEIAIDAEGRLYFVDTYLADNTISRWRIEDGTPTWESSRPIQGTAWLDDRPWLAAQGDGIVYFVGNNAGSYIGLTEEDGSMFFYRSTDAGDTWTLGDAFPRTGWCDLAASRADDRTVLAACYRASEEEFVTFLSTDRGDTFEEAVAGPLETGGANFPAATFDFGGAPYAAWIDGYYWLEGNETLRFARQHDGAWESLDVTPFSGSLGYVAIAGGPPGTVAILFYGADDAEPTAETEWYGRVLLTRDAHAEVPRWQSGLLDPTPVAVGVEPNMDFFQAAFAPDGTLHVAYARQAEARTGERALDRLVDEILHVSLPPANP